ncbi:MAG: hypothetical protein N2596_09345, partial [Syntrophorhabdaceae bacterium]|nr:hypothetical protein [Syntrophorhabdaceae bacterium]
MQTAKNTILKITPEIKKQIIKIIDERIKQAHVTKEDFSELKAIVKDLGIKTAELAEAQKRTEERVEELAQAQKRTEERVEELAQAQKRTEKRVEELAQAQKRTEEALTILTREHGITRKMLGGLSLTVGYRLEDEAFKALPQLLLENHGITVKGRLKRAFIKDKKNRDIE